MACDPVPLKYAYLSAPVATTGIEIAPCRVSIAQSCLRRSRKMASLALRVETLGMELRAAVRKSQIIQGQNRNIRSLLQTRTGVPPEANSWAWLFTTDVACPSCHSEMVHRSHRRGELEQALSVFALPFRCDDCATRFFVC